MATLLGANRRIAADQQVSALATAHLRTLSVEDIDQLATLYLSCYPPAVGAADLAEARLEMVRTIAGEFGDLRLDASYVATVRESLVGSIQVVKRSPWDPRS